MSGEECRNAEPLLPIEYGMRAQISAIPRTSHGTGSMRRRPQPAEPPNAEFISAVLPPSGMTGQRTRLRREFQDAVRKLIQQCAAVGGVFTMLWHDNNLLPPLARYYPSILDMLCGTPDCDWWSDFAQLRLLSHTQSLLKFFSHANGARAAMLQPPFVSLT